MLKPEIYTFLKAADCGSFSSAAEKLYLSKVSVMKQINHLEGSVGVPLFRRSNHGIKLTDAGKSFYAAAHRMVELSTEAIEEAQKAGGKQIKVIRIGTSMMRPCNKLVELWESVALPHQDYQFNIVPVSDDGKGLQRFLKSLGQTIDCFVSPCGTTSILMNYGFLPLKSYPYAIAMSRKHRLAKKEILHWTDLDGETLLLVKRGESYVVDEIRNEISLHHPQIKVSDFDGYYDIRAFNQCEQEGHLMGTIPLWSALHPSLITVPVAWDYKMPYGILYEKTPSQNLREFLSYFNNSAK